MSVIKVERIETAAIRTLGQFCILCILFYGLLICLIMIRTKNGVEGKKEVGLTKSFTQYLVVLWQYKEN